jgi:ABC-type dipeptide/oligopeptide/nickel transport system permease subunit
LAGSWRFANHAASLSDAFGLSGTLAAQYWRFMARRLQIGLVVLAALLVLGMVLPPFAPDDPTVWQLSPPNLPPSAAHWFATTGLGQDGFWLLTWGPRNSLSCRRWVRSAAAACVRAWSCRCRIRR